MNEAVYHASINKAWQGLEPMSPDEFRRMSAALRDLRAPEAVHMPFDERLRWFMRAVTAIHAERRERQGEGMSPAYAELHGVGTE